MTYRLIATSLATFGFLLAFAAGTAHATPGSVSYVYDDLGRLVELVYDDGTTITYTYDAVGNRETTVTTLP